MGTQLAPDRLIARLAVRQAGVVSFSQLAGFGLSRRQIGVAACKPGGYINCIVASTPSDIRAYAAKDGGGRLCWRSGTTLS